jgi:hypothetical protein
MNLTVDVTYAFEGNLKERVSIWLSLPVSGLTVFYS